MHDSSLCLTSSSSSSFGFLNSCKLRFPFVSVFNKLLLIIKQLLVEIGSILKVWTLNRRSISYWNIMNDTTLRNFEIKTIRLTYLDNSVYWASFLAETAENALGHIDIILGCSSWAVWSRFWLNYDSECWACSLAKFAGNASFLTSRVSSECVLSSEHWWKRTFLPRIVNDVLYDF